MAKGKSIKSHAVTKKARGRWSSERRLKTWQRKRTLRFVGDTRLAAVNNETLHQHRDACGVFIA